MKTLRIDSGPPYTKYVWRATLRLLLCVVAVGLAVLYLAGLHSGSMGFWVSYIITLIGILGSVARMAWKSRRLRGTQTVVIVGARTIAVKAPNSPAVFIPWRLCVDYYPYGETFVTASGHTYSLNLSSAPHDTKTTVRSFIFQHCWPDVERDAFLGAVTPEHLERFQSVVRAGTGGWGRLMPWGSWALILIAVLSSFIFESKVLSYVFMAGAVVLALIRLRAQRLAWRNLLSHWTSVRVSLVQEPQG